jgi:hypothetical protein
MSRRIRVLLVLGSIIVGYIALWFGYNGSFISHWLNTALLITGIIFAGFGLLYIFIKMIIALVNNP